MPVGPKSLVPSLWDEYLIARGSVRNWRDLGTYNPASRLPSGKPSDHAQSPAYAFDVGGDPSGLERLFQLMAGRPGVEYVIYKNKIWSRGKGLHEYTAGGHETHVHVSGVRISASQQRRIAAAALAKGGYSISDLLGDVNKYRPTKGIATAGDELLEKIPVAGGPLSSAFSAAVDPLGIVGGPVGAVKGTVEAIKSPFEAIGWVMGNWDRVLEVVAGFVFLLVGLLLLGRAVLGSKVPGPVGDLANRAQFGPTVTQARSGTPRQNVYLEEAPRPKATGSSQSDEIPF